MCLVPYGGVSSEESPVSYSDAVDVKLRDR